jgi:hypothetical protein
MIEKERGIERRGRGFTSHPLMGAALLCGGWVAIYFTHVIPGIRAGGIAEVIAIAAGVIGAIGAPALLIFTEGDEGLGILGIIAALLVGWVSARLAMVFHASPGAVESARLSGAALGPILLYAGFSLRTWTGARRKRKPSMSSQDKAD